MKKERTYLYDNYKFILMFLVVLGHFVSDKKVDFLLCRELFTYIYSFHMPAFIFVSGLFCKSTISSKKESGKFRVEKVISFLLIAALYRTIKNCVLLLLGESCGWDYFSGSDLNWYMMAMALWLCITYLFKDFKPQFIFVISIIFGVLIGFNNDGSGDFLAIVRTIVYYPFFYVGYLLNIEKLTKFIQKPVVRIAGIIISIAYLIFVFSNIREGLRIDDMGQLFSGHNSYEKIAEYWPNITWVYRLVWYPIVGIVITALLACVPSKKIPVVSTAGSRTLAVYFFHLPIKYIIKHFGFYDVLMKCFGPHYWQYAMILFCLIYQLILSTKIFSKPLDMILSCKYKKLLKEKKDFN